MSVEAFLLYVYVVQVFTDFEMKMRLLYYFAWGGCHAQEVSSNMFHVTCTCKHSKLLMFQA